MGKAGQSLNGPGDVPGLSVRVVGAQMGSNGPIAGHPEVLNGCAIAKADEILSGAAAGHPRPVLTEP